jgi:hypothetical protein
MPQAKFVLTEMRHVEGLPAGKKSVGAECLVTTSTHPDYSREFRIITHMRGNANTHYFAVPGNIGVYLPYNVPLYHIKIDNVSHVAMRLDNALEVKSILYKDLDNHVRKCIKAHRDALGAIPRRK